MYASYIVCKKKFFLYIFGKIFSSMKKILCLNLISLVLLSCNSIYHLNLKPQYSHLNKVPVENILSNEIDFEAKCQPFHETYSKELKINSEVVNHVLDTSLTSSYNTKQINHLTFNKANKKNIKSNQWQAGRKQVLLAKNAISKNMPIDDYLSREDIIFWLIVIILVAVILSILRIDIISILVVILLILIIILLLQLLGISI